MRIKRTDQLADDLTGLRRRIEVLEIKEGRGTPDDGGGEEPPPPGSPTVTAISPSQGIPQGGTNVTITGTNFTNVTGVVFGSTPATSFQVVSPTQINATAPANLSGVPGGGGNPTPTGKFTITGDGRIEDPNGLPWVACGGNIGGVRPTGGSQTGSQVLPAKILGGVLEPNYGGGPANLPDVYNLQLYQFCYIDEDGHLSWPYMSGWMGDYADESTIRAQIEAAQAEGQVILWDIGGGDDGNPLPVLNGLHTQTAQDNFFNDMVDFVDTFGFQGIAWGIEQWDGHEVPGGISSTGVVAVSRRLKAHYGPQFVVGIVSIINDFEQLTSEIGRELQRTGELDFFRFEFYNLWGWYVTGPEVINIIQQTINNIGYGFSANQFVVGHAAGLGATQGNGEPITLEDCLTSWDEAVQVYPDLRGVITYGPFTLDGEVLDYAWSAAMAERLFTGDTPSFGPGGATPGNWWYEANPAVDHTQDAENYGFNMMRLILFDGWEGDGWSYEQMRDGLFASIDAHIAKGIVVTWSLEALRGTNPTLTTVQNHYATKLQDDVVARYKSHAAGHYVWLNTLSAPYDYNNDSTWATVNSWLYSRARSQGWTHMQIVDLPGEGNDMSAAATEQFILDFMQGKTNVILGAHLYSPSGTLSVTGPQIRSRNLPLIVTEFGYAEGGSSTATDWVFASAWSGSLRFGGLMWQVAGDPDNDFTFRTGAGSAYWEATKALTALGQAMFDRGQLQLNSYDDGSSGGSGLSMEVIESFNTGTQPSDANMTVIGGNTVGGSSTGTFHVEGGVIIDPNGVTFTPWGGATVARPTGVVASHAVFGTDSAYSYANGNATRARADGWNATAVTVLLPSLETTPPFTLAQSLEGLGQMLDEWTAQGIVCIVSPSNLTNNPASYAAVNAEIRAVQEYVCANYADNPFVWLETMGDSWDAATSVGGGQWPNWNVTNTQCFNDAVARGWTNMQVFVLPGEGDDLASVANGSLFDSWLAGKGDRVCLGWYNFGAAGTVGATLTLVQAITARNVPIICTSFGQNWNDGTTGDGGSAGDAVGVDYTTFYGQTSTLHTGGIAWRATGPRTTANDYSWRYNATNGGVFRPWHDIAENLNEVGRLIRDRAAQGYDVIGGGPIGSAPPPPPPSGDGPTTARFFYGGTGIFNTLVTQSSVQLHPRSAAIVAGLAGGTGDRGITAEAYAMSVVDVDPNGKTYQVIIRNDSIYGGAWGGSGDWGFNNVTFLYPTIKIQPGAQVPSGTDGALVIRDWVNERAVSLWIAEIDEANSRIIAEWGGAFPANSDGNSMAPNYSVGPYQQTEPINRTTGTGAVYGHTAIGTCGYQGCLTFDDLQRGYINHALVFVTSLIAGPPQSPGTAFYYPATTNDGSEYGGARVEGGSRFHLTMSDAAINNISHAGQRLIARALKDYGAFVCDYGGSMMTYPVQRPRVGNAAEAALFTDYGFSVSGDGWNAMNQIDWSQAEILIPR